MNVNNIDAQQLSPEAFKLRCSLVALLYDPDNIYYSLRAMEDLVQTAPELLMQHIDANRAKLFTNRYFELRSSAVRALSKLPEAFKVKLAHIIFDALEDSEEEVRESAVQVLSSMPGQHERLVTMLGDADWRVRSLTLKIMGRRFSTKELATHAPAVVAVLDDDRFYPAQLAVRTLDMMPMSTLAQHHEALAVRLRKRKVPKGLGKLVGRLAWYRCKTKLLLQQIIEPWAIRAWAPGKRTHAMLCRAHANMDEDVNERARRRAE